VSTLPAVRSRVRTGSGVVAARFTAAGGVLLGALVGVATAISPATASAGVIGLATVLVALAQLTWALHTFAAVSSIVEVVGYPPAVFVRVVALVVSAAWVLDWGVRRRNRQPGLLAIAPAVAISITLFLVWIVLSVLWAADRSAAESEVIRYVSAMLFVAISAYGLSTRVALVRQVSVLSVSLGVAAVGSLLLGAQVGDRLTSSGTDPNYLAMGFLAGAILAAGMAVITRNWWRIVYLATIAACLVGMVATQSRGGIVGGVVALVVWVIFGGRRRRQVMIVVAAVAIAGSGYVYLLAPAATRDRLTGVVSASSTDEGTGRLDIWRVGLETFKAHPLVGVGIGNYTVVTPQYVPNAGLVRRDDLIIVNTKVAHNIFLNIAVDTGVVGFVLFYSAVGGCLVLMLRSARRAERDGDEDLGWVMRACLAATAGVIGADFFISAQYTHVLWLLLALGPAAAGVTKLRSATQQRSIV
jgi:O-antigen ligase